MNIKLYEFKKVITSPIIIVLTILFVLFNIMNINNSSYIKDDIKAINKIIGDFGQEINENTIDEMKLKGKENLEIINQISKDKFNKTFESISDFIESDEYTFSAYDDKAFTKEEKQFIIKANALDFYANVAMDTVRDYENLDMVQIGESQIEAYGIKGKSEDLIRENYKKLEARFEEIQENEEHKNLFFPGKLFETHKLLYGEILRTCIFEIVILVVLISTYLINYEFDNKTSLLVYSTKIGRKNVKDKLTVCIISSLLISIIILGITLIAYFITFDYSNVLKVPINSAFNWDYILPYISWFNITFIEHLGLSLLVILITVPIFASITFIIAKTIKNSYIVFFVFFIVFGICIMIPTLVSTSSPLITKVGYDIFNLILSSDSFFMQRGPFNLNRYYEVMTLLAWTMIVIIGNILTIRRFKRIDIN